MSEEKDAPKVREIRRSEDRFLGSDLFESGARQLPPRNGSGTVAEAAREVPGLSSLPGAGRRRRTGRHGGGLGGGEGGRGRRAHGALQSSWAASRPEAS